jgi:hypothetical protein
LTGWLRIAVIQSSTFGEWWMAWHFHARRVEDTVNSVQHDVLQQQHQRALHPERPTLHGQEFRLVAAVEHDNAGDEHGRLAHGQEQRHDEPVDEIGDDGPRVLPPVHAGVAGHQTREDGKRDAEPGQPFGGVQPTLPDFGNPFHGTEPSWESCARCRTVLQTILNPDA